MTLDNGMSPALREMTERAAQELDPQELCRLILEVNVLLGVIEQRLAEPESQNHQSSPSG
jgi:hypothetical protein